MVLFIILIPAIIYSYYLCINKKIKNGYEQRFKYMNRKQRIALFANILVFITGICLIILGFYKNISTKNYFKKNGLYAEGEIINDQYDGQDLWYSSYTCKIQIENNGNKQHYYAWTNRAGGYRISENVNIYYIENQYTENYVGVINAMIEGDNYCKTGEILLHVGSYLIIIAPVIWLVRHNY